MKSRKTWTAKVCDMAMAMPMDAAMAARGLTGAAIVAAVVLVATAVTAVAEQTSAESPDFTVSTVPEPMAIAAVVVPFLIAARRKRFASWQCTSVGQQ